jgi:hypothetical protein
VEAHSCHLIELDKIENIWSNY